MEVKKFNEAKSQKNQNQNFSLDSQGYMSPNFQLRIKHFELKD